MARFAFDTTDYEFTHGRKPRGRGGWAFSFERHPDVLSDAVVWTPSMTYVEAKRWFAAEAARRGVTEGTVYVLT